MSVNDDVVPDNATVKRIAKKVRERRESLDLDQDLARYGGPSRSTVSVLENKDTWPLRARTRASWATALGWEPDAFDRMERGEEPIELKDGKPSSANAQEEQVELLRNARALLAELERRLDPKAGAE